MGKKKRKNPQKIITQKSKIDNFLAYLEEKPYIPIIFTFLLIYIILWIQMNPVLMFTNTILTGGDTASWYQVTEHLRNTLIPNGRLTGWSQANYFGYNEFQFYFIPPFLLTTILSLVIPLPIALKLVTMLGIYLFPVSVFYMLRKITKNLWISLIGTIFSMFFIMNESYHIFGGNILSTFAGEFSFMLAFDLFIIFLGVCWDTFQNNKSPLKAGLILGLIGLTHLFVFMPAFFVPFFFVFAKKIQDLKMKDILDPPWEEKQLTFPHEIRIEKILLIYLYAVLVMAFWIIPVIAYRPYSQPIAMKYFYEGAWDFINKTMLGVIIAGISAAFLLFFNSKQDRVFTGFVIYIYLVSIFFYIVSGILHIPDIRFIPELIFISFPALILLIPRVPLVFPKVKRSPMIVSFYTILLLSLAFFFSFYPQNTNHVYERNYGGYEETPLYGALMEMATNYSGDINSGRMLWEKIAVENNDDLGSTRAFENLYLFMGRPTTEGIHHGSSFMARMATYMKSEFSEHIVDAEQFRLFASINPEVWPLRFYQVNAKDIILHTSYMSSLFKVHPDFELTGTFDKYRVFTYESFPDSYIQVMDLSNFSIVDTSQAGFRNDFYRFFRDYEYFAHPFISLQTAGELSNTLSIFTNYDHYKYSFNITEFDFGEWLSNYTYTNAIITEDIDHLAMSFTTTEVGKPHILKVTYDPHFRSVNGEPIYAVSPGFMMIIPESEEVTIEYGWTRIEVIAYLITLLLLPLIIFHKKIESIRFSHHELIKKIAIGIFIAGIVGTLAVRVLSPASYVKSLNKAGALYVAGEYEKALKIIDRYANLETMDLYENQYIYRFYLLKANTLYQMGKIEESTATFDYLMFRFPRVRLNESLEYENE